MRVHLEDLTSDPRLQLERLAEILGLDWNDYLEGFANGLPVVNARGSDTGLASPRLSMDVDDVLEEVAPIAQKLGCAT